MKRKQHSKEFKAKVALEALKGQKTANEIAAEYGVHPSQINTWKKRVLEALPEAFSRGQDRDAAQREAEQDRDAKAVDHPCDHIAPLVVRAQPVLRRRRRRGGHRR